MEFKKLNFEEKPSFLDYVVGGLEISLLIAIDFTKSNGDSSEESSLHYIDTKNPNEYMKAIKSVGEILQYYDNDHKIPVYGFGAKILPFKATNFCFALNGNIFDPEVEGIEGVLEVYKKSIKHLVFHGPTYFH